MLRTAEISVPEAAEMLVSAVPGRSLIQNARRPLKELLRGAGQVADSNAGGVSDCIGDCRGDRSDRIFADPFDPIGANAAIVLNQYGFEDRNIARGGYLVVAEG